MLKKLYSLRHEMVIKFIFFGSLIFITDHLLFSDSDLETIYLDERNFYSYLNDRYELHDREQVEAYLYQVGPARMEELKQAFIDDQLLYQFATDNQLERSDGLLKSMIAAKGGELLQVLTTSRIDPVSTEEVVAEYDKHLSHYFTPQTWSFEVRHYANRALATDALSRLNQGEDLPLHRESGVTRPFVEYGLTHGDIAQYYSPVMAESLTDVDTHHIWLGPFMSAQHAHIVRITETQAESTTPLAQVEDSIRIKLEARRDQQAYEKELERLRSHAKIVDRLEVSLW